MAAALGLAGIAVVLMLGFAMLWASARVELPGKVRAASHVAGCLLVLLGVACEALWTQG